MNLEATVLLMTVERGEAGSSQRRYRQLNLERSSVYFFPLTWTIVHPLDEASPVYEWTPNEYERTQAEFLVLIKGFDETFSQTVHARYSYRYDELLWDARFRPAFHVDDVGDLVLHVDEVGAVGTVRAATHALEENAFISVNQPLSFGI